MNVGPPKPVLSPVFSVFMCFLDTGHSGNVLLTREATSVVTAVTDIISRRHYEIQEGLGGGKRDGSY